MFVYVHACPCFATHVSMCCFPLTDTRYVSACVYLLICVWAQMCMHACSCTDTVSVMLQLYGWKTIPSFHCFHIWPSVCTHVLYVCSEISYVVIGSYVLGSWIYFANKKGLICWWEVLKETKKLWGFIRCMQTGTSFQVLGTFGSANCPFYIEFYWSGSVILFHLLRNNSYLVKLRLELILKLQTFEDNEDYCFVYQTTRCYIFRVTIIGTSYLTFWINWL
jgi:hypothetical protein